MEHTFKVVVDRSLRWDEKPLDIYGLHEAILANRDYGVTIFNATCDDSHDNTIGSI